jgi:YHS domain-containing protein
MTLRTATIALLVVLLPSLAAAQASSRSVPRLPEPAGLAEVFQRDELTGLALSGLDPVTFFLPDGPKPGRTELQAVWAGVAWRFASEANKAAFVASPDAYAPRIGGYDALAASQKRIVNASPAFHVVRDGRLYLFRSEDSRARFLADATIPARSEEAWLGLRAELVQR